MKELITIIATIILLTSCGNDVYEYRCEVDYCEPNRRDTVNIISVNYLSTPGIHGNVLICQDRVIAIGVCSFNILSTTKKEIQ